MVTEPKPGGPSGSDGQIRAAGVRDPNRDGELVVQDAQRSGGLDAGRELRLGVLGAPPERGSRR